MKDNKRRDILISSRCFLASGQDLLKLLFSVAGEWMTDKIVMVFAIAGVNCVKVKRLVRVMDYGPKDLQFFM